MQTNSGRVIPVGIEYLPDIVFLERQCFSRPWSPSQYRQFLERDNFRVMGIFEAEILIAYISFYFLHDEAEIINLAVSHDFRRKGLGSSLVSKVLDVCLEEKVKMIFLEVRPSNVPALCIYRRLGFQEAGRRKQYYPDNLEDALILSLDLYSSEV